MSRFEIHRFHFERRIGRYDDRQLLGRGHHAAHGMNRELLDDAINRCGQDLELYSLIRLRQIVTEVGSLRSASARSLEQLPMKFRRHLPLGSRNCR